MTRCDWAEGVDEAYVRYHDEEWGVPQRDDVRLFEMLTLEGAQAGLSWSTILRKREGYRRLFHDFDIERVAAMSAADVKRVLADASIVRNRMKVESTVANARAVLALTDDLGTLSSYVWSFVDGEPLRNAWLSVSDVPAETDLSRAMSRDMKRRGFRFVGPTVCYAFMQACGLVNDHVVSCFRYEQV